MNHVETTVIKIRIDVPAVISGALIVGLYTMIAAHLMARSQNGSIWTSDHMLVVTLSAATIYGVLFFFGIHYLRQVGIRSRAGYVTLGMVTATPAFVVGVGWNFFASAIANGALALALLRPMIVGAIAGFLYRRRAGFETHDDNPEALSQSIETQQEAYPMAKANGSSAVLSTATTEYYTGPLQIRSSFIAALIAAILGSSVHTLTSYFGLIVDPLPAGALPPTFASPGRAAALGIIGIAVPYLIFVLVARGALARCRKTSMTAFVVTGLVTPLCFGFMFAVLGMGPLAFIMIGQFIIPSAVAMATYRSVAGLEPLALPDDVEVTDRRTLIPENHVRRRVSRVIDVSK